jgi:hypothetical protein
VSVSANVRFRAALVCDAQILPTLRLFDCVNHFLRKRDHLHRNAELLRCKRCPSASIHYVGCAHVSEERYNRVAQGGQMADIKRISVQQAHAKTKANQALLVCAYEDEAKCRMLNLDGSISFATLQSRAASLPKTQEIIFY